MTYQLASMAAVSALLVASPALAQVGPPTGPQSWTAVRFQRGREVRVSTRWTAVERRGQRSGSVSVTDVSTGRETELYTGPAVRTDAVVSDEALLVGMVHAGARPFVKLVVVPMHDGVLGAPAVTVEAQRQGGTQFQPDTIVTCSEPGGFAVLWQELSATDGRDARSYLGHVSTAGQWTAAPRIVNVPWALGAMAWNGNGYSLALYYSQTSPEQTRICGVTLSREGTPEQHPWWASPQELVGEILVEHVGGRLVAVYRGGADGRTIRSIDLSEQRAWGVEPPQPASHGPILDTQDFGVQVDSSGAIQVVRR